jgi:hypothetical protein
MPFLRLQEDRCVNTDQIADLSYLPTGPVQPAESGSEATPTQSAHLNISLSNGETISVEGADADVLWEAAQSSFQQFPPQPDWFLQLLVNMANGGLHLGLTLQVSGFLVSGELVGGRDYFDGMGEEFANGIHGLEDPGDIRGSFAALRDQYYPEKADTTKKPGPMFIHLKNARFFNTAGNPIPGNRGVWWRGRLSEVSGFILGGLSASVPA